MAWTARNNEEESEYFDKPKILNQKISKLARLIQNSNHFTCFTGAGISTSAGIADYRSGLNTVLETGAGAWAIEAASEKGIDVTPKRKIKRVAMLNAMPTPTHMALVELNNNNILKYLISQNVDGLHRRSGFNPKCLSELHGNSNLELCKICGKKFLRDYDVCIESNSCDNHLTGRRCKNKLKSKNGKQCNGKLYDTIINFGENLRDYAWKPAEKNATKSDLCLVLGSSVTVSPAADLPEMIGKNHKLCIVNLQKTPLDHLCDVRIHAKCDDVIELLMNKLGLQIPEWILKRYVHIKVDFKTKNIWVAGVDCDGIKYDLFTVVKLIINKQKHIVKRGSVDGVVFRKCLKSNNDSIELALEFMGHYDEPKVVIDVNQYIYSLPAEEFMLRLLYNPYDKQWTVYKEGMSDGNECYEQKQKIYEKKSSTLIGANDEKLGIINLHTIRQNVCDDALCMGYCRICTIPYEYCRYGKTYLNCLCYCFKDNINVFKSEVKTLKKRNSDVFRQISPLLFIYCGFREYNDIANDLVQLLVMFVGTYDKNFKSKQNVKKSIETQQQRNNSISNKKRIIVSLQRRKGNKKVTRVVGLLELNMKEKEAKKTFRQKFATSVACNWINGSKEKKEFILQGDVRYDFMKFMRSKYDVPANILFYKKEEDLFNACNEHGMVVLPVN